MTTTLRSVTFLQGFLIFATLVGFAADAYAILKGGKRFAIALLGVVGVLLIALTLETIHVTRLSAENRALTDTQARAQKLHDSWTRADVEFGPEFGAEFNSVGTNEGIAAAAADLMEDVKACRPGAAEEARLRLKTARAEAGEILDKSSSEFFAVWANAASAAVEQVAGVAEVPPNC